MSRMGTTPQTGLGSTSTGGLPASSSQQGPAGNQTAAPESLRQRVAMRAYDKWLRRGCQHGSDRQDWLEAEAEVRAELNRSGPSTGTGGYNYR